MTISRRSVRPGSVEVAIRLPDSDEPDTVPQAAAHHADRVLYWKHPGGWSVFIPFAGRARLDAENVEEHEDGSITMRSPFRVRAIGGGMISTRAGRLIEGEWHEE